MDLPIVVYRNPLPLIAGLLGFGLIFGFLLFDAFRVIPTAFSSTWPWGVRAGVLVAGAAITYLMPAVYCVRQPVVVIDEQGVAITRTMAPWRSTRVKRSQITQVKYWSLPDTVPSYLIFVVTEIDESQRSSAVWDRIVGLELHLEFSNLTMDAVRTARAIEEAYGL